MVRKMIHSVNKFLSDPYYQFGSWMFERFSNLMNDKYFLTVLLFKWYGKKVNLDNPTNLVEKLNYLKLYDHNPLYTKLVDKYEVKNYISEILGPQYVVPTLLICNSIGDLNWSLLPNSFAIKCTHDSGSTILIYDKRNCDKKAVISKLNKHLHHNFYSDFREWPYKNVLPRIICEPLLTDQKSAHFADYKFYFYGGHLEYFMYSIGEAQHSSQNIKFNKYKQNIDYLFKLTPTLDAATVRLPDNIDEMIECAEKIGSRFQHIRVDMYNIEGHIYVGELTFYSNAGFVNIYDEVYASHLANLIDLSKTFNGDV